ncbi:YcjX family protein [Rhodoligotrophos defluvii]|uniref:YcjX family protein n=1 Tax=Rhodoligotrophos defluvii TaxID=2561934 RepID=UPI001EF0A7E3|nr:YcjX family protein [Rhodoligotrophos defluvii]
MARSTLGKLTDRGLIALSELADYASAFGNPSLRLGVTGLSRSGKTVFITALVHNLLHGGRLPLFDPQAEQRIIRAYLEPQPDDAVPRFAYEDHVEALIGKDRHWPESTRRMSQLRLTVEFLPRGQLARRLGRNRLHIDIVDYPGEWLLDLPLLDLSYEAWSAEMIAASRRPTTSAHAGEWHALLTARDPQSPADEPLAVKSADAFRRFLIACRDDQVALSFLPPGRFLMPGDLEGSPLLTFAPLDVPSEGTPPKGSYWAMMARRYDAYVRHVVRPFFREHFSRLDRQIVLMDALAALNAGAEAVSDLGRALTDVLLAFRHGRANPLASMFGRRIDRIMIAATKADYLHHTSHDRLEAIASRLVQKATEHAAFAGADVEVTALAAIRATREAEILEDGERLPCIVGVPQAGERLGNEYFDGEREAAIFPGDLPDNPDDALAGAVEGQVRFIRFRPPMIDASRWDLGPSFPHIRLDRTLNFLLSDFLA